MNQTNIFEDHNLNSSNISFGCFLDENFKDEYYISIGEDQKGINFYKNMDEIKDFQISSQNLSYINISHLPTNEDIDKGILFNDKKLNFNGEILQENNLSYANPENEHITTKDLNNNLLLKRKKGRQRNSDNHNKFSDDNLRRKCKHLVLSSLFIFINQKINEACTNNIGKGVCTKKLLSLNQKQKSESSIKFNKVFLKKTIGDILSENISGKYTNFPSTHNKNLVNYLKNDINENNRNYFITLFNLSFLDCLKHFRGSEIIPSLKGLIGFDNIKDNYKEDEDYLKTLEYYIKNFEEIINNKRERKKRKKAEETNQQHKES